MKTRLTFTVLALALLAGCSGTANTETPTTPSEERSAASATEVNGSELSGDLTVFAAASLQEAFDDLLEEFGKEHPEVAIIPAVYDGSSTLVTQLGEGAQADVLATANEATMDDAVEAEVMTSTPELVATNTLVIAVPEDNPHGVSDLPDVLDLDYAICAVQVPCGDATAQLFEAAELTLEPISEEQNVTSVANRVSSGDVDAGFIYATDVAARPELIGIAPTAAQVVNRYPMGATSQSEVGAGFVEFVNSADGAAILESYGFGTP